MKALTLILTFCIFFADAAFSQAGQTATQSQLLADNSFKPNNAMLPNKDSDFKCAYFINITTSCLSPPSTRDNISIAFSDADGNQVYLERQDIPGASGIFEQCSTDALKISSTKCINQICYFALMRSGQDGWMPKKVTIGGSNNPFPLEITYESFLTQDLWYGINKC